MLGLGHGVKLVRPVARDSVVTWSDVAAIDSEAARVRREMEAVFSADEMTSMLELSRKGVSEIISLQKAAILTADRAAPADLASLAAAFAR